VNYITEIEKLVPIPTVLKGTAADDDVYDYEPMRQIIEDAGMDVIRNIEQFKKQDLNLFVTPIFVDASGTALETGIVEYVERNSKSCMEIQPAMKNMAKDSISLNYATEEYPIFYREHGKIYVLPEPQELKNTFESSKCLFSESVISDGTSNYSVTDVTFFEDSFIFTANTSAEDLSPKLVSHGLQTGDYLEIKQTLSGNDTYFSIPKSYVIRISANTVRFVGHVWNETSIANGLTDDLDNDHLEASDSWHYANTVYQVGSILGDILYVEGYQPRASESIAYIVKPPSTRGEQINIEGDYYNSDSNQVETATNSAFADSNTGTTE
jgi:hypothetical protein